MGPEVLGCDGLGNIPSLKNPWGVTSHSGKKQPGTGEKNICIGESQISAHRACFRYTKTPFHEKKISQSPLPLGKGSARG